MQHCMKESAPVDLPEKCGFHVTVSSGPFLLDSLKQKKLEF